MSNLVVVSIAFFIINIHLLALIRGQLVGPLKANGSMKQQLGFSDKFSALPNGRPVKLRQIFVEPLEQTTNDSAPLKREMGEKVGGEAGGEAVGCFRNKRRRRRRQQMGCACVGCALCDYNHCDEQRTEGENVPISIAQPQNAIVPLPLQQISPTNLYKIAPQHLDGLFGENDWHFKQKTPTKGLEQRLTAGQMYPQGLMNAASANDDQIQPHHYSHSHPSSAADNRQHAAIVHRPHSDSAYAKVPQIARKYPLPECYTDESSFMCCNAQLEETIHQAYQHLIDTIQSFHNCNIQKISNTVQSFAEKRFNVSFEVVTGLTDYASKSHFYGNYICKVQRDNRFILAYATPRWEIEENGGNKHQHFVM